jgi:hypothetical protein
MEKTTLEKRIIEKAEKKFQEEMIKTIKLLQENPILSRLKIFIDDKEYFELSSRGGYCPARTLFCSDYTLVIKSTNIQEIKKLMIADYEKYETDQLLNTIESVRAFIENVK